MAKHVLTRHISYKKHTLITLRENLGSLLVCWYSPCCSSF